MNKRTIQLQQLSAKMQALQSLKQLAIPPVGWVRAIRTALGISMEQLSKKLSIAKQSVQKIEEREKDGTITINSLKTVAKALDMQLVYGFVPNDGSLDALIERKAKELAKKIVLRTSNTMKLEGQENSDTRIEKAMQERIEDIKNKMPKALWD